MIPTPSSTAAPILTERAADRALRRHHETRAIGLKIAWQREQAGVTRAELAAYVGVGASTIARIESGARAVLPHERIMIARALGASLATFIVSSDGTAA